MGVEPVNAAVEGWLADEGLIRPEGRWYAHRPVLVTQNDYGVRLFNGDAGVVLPDETGELRVWFPGEAGGPPRALHPARLPPHASLWAMTVHRSQGSEFDRVVVLLPPQVSRILTRELLYTAVTRAKRQVTVVGSEEVIGGAVDRRVQRASGLRELLWG